MKQEALSTGDALEGTFGGALFDGVKLKLADGTEPTTWGIWDSMSACLAGGMTGQVTINMLFGLRPGSVFERVESKELEPLMQGPTPVVSGITVRRFLRAQKGVDGTGNPYTNATSGAELHEEIACTTVDEALNAEPYRWDRNVDLPNPYFAVKGGHDTGAPPAYDPTTSTTPAADRWGWRDGLEGSGQTPEW